MNKKIIIITTGKWHWHLTLGMGRICIHASCKMLEMLEILKEKLEQNSGYYEYN